MALDDLAKLPMNVAMSARVDPDGEISWPMEIGELAIDALAGAGFVIFGLNARLLDQDRIVETVWSTFEPGDCDDAAAMVARSRAEALETLAREETDEFGSWLLISWALPESAA